MYFNPPSKFYAIFSSIFRDIAVAPVAPPPPPVPPAALAAWDAQIVSVGCELEVYIGLDING